MTEHNRANLFKKILAVQKVLEPLGKSGRNEFYKYSYSTAGDVLLPVQRACNEYGLVLVADVIDTKINPERAGAEVIVQLSVFDSETGESHRITAPGYAEDWSYKDSKPTGDKAVYKAITGATKYAVRSLFCLPSEDDPERTNYKTTTTTARPTVNNSRHSFLINQTTSELKRLGWSNDRGKLYLQNEFGKNTRSELTVQELQEFLDDLKSMQPATPVATE